MSIKVKKVSVFFNVSKEKNVVVSLRTQSHNQIAVRCVLLIYAAKHVKCLGVMQCHSE